MTLSKRSWGAALGALALTAALAAGCDDQYFKAGGNDTAPAASDDGAASSKNAGRGGRTATSGPGLTPDMRRAFECWGLTHGSYFLHQASPQTAGDLPRAAPQDYMAWGNKAAVLVRDSGGTLAQYNAWKKEFQTMLIREEERRQVAPRLRACIETAPRDMLDVEQPILTDAG